MTNSLITTDTVRTWTVECHRCKTYTERRYLAAWNVGDDRVEWVGSCECGAHLIKHTAGQVIPAVVDSQADVDAVLSQPDTYTMEDDDDDSDVIAHTGDLSELLTVVKSFAFDRHYNVIDVNTHHVGNIVDTERGYEVYVARTEGEEGEDYVGVTDDIDSSAALLLPYL